MSTNPPPAPSSDAAPAAAPLAVVTGASSGIGLELARVFAENGHDLVVAAQDAAIHEVAATLRVGGRTVEAVQVDLAASDGVDRLWERVLAVGRPADVVAINAGVAVGGPFAETELAAEVQLIELNVTSSVRLAKRAVQAMVARNAGRILVTSSIAAEAPGPYTAIYSASKAFLTSFAASVRHELRDTAVTITTLEPGATDTPILERSGMADTRLAAGSKSEAADVARTGYAALMAGKDRVVAGTWIERTQVAVAPVIPERLKAAIAGHINEPGGAR